MTLGEQPDRGRVAVVGGGVSGLACGRTLAGRGLAVTVFDKGRGPGGRAATRRADGGLAFDHGAQYFTARDPDFLRQVAAWREAGVAAEWAGRIVKLEGGAVTDIGPQPRYVGVPGMAALGADLAAGLAVRRELRVTRAVRGGRGWELADAAGGEHGPFDVLVIALPAPQAADLLGPHPLAAEARAVPMTPCWAVMAAFDRPYPVPWDGAFVHGSPLSWAARNGSKPGRPAGPECWVVQATPAWSTEHLEAPPEEVAPRLLAALGDATGEPAPPTAYLTAHRWRYSQGGGPAGPRALFDPAAGLAVCGDWLAGGRVEGAYLAGVSAAGCVLRHAGREPSVQGVTR